jgi:hypothetical protein
MTGREPTGTAVPLTPRDRHGRSDGPHQTMKHRSHNERVRPTGDRDLRQHRPGVELAACDDRGPRVKGMNVHLVGGRRAEPSPSVASWMAMIAPEPALLVAAEDDVLVASVCQLVGMLNPPSGLRARIEGHAHAAFCLRI